MEKFLKKLQEIHGKFSQESHTEQSPIPAIKLPLIPILFNAYFIFFDNVKKFCSLDDVVASHICSLNCAKMLGIDDKVGSIKEKKNADFLILNKNYEIEEVYINGEKVL